MRLVQTFRQIERYQQIVTILLKNGFEDLVTALGIERYMRIPFVKPSAEIEKMTRSQRIRKTVEALGPTFIKFAQILSTRPDLIPLELANEFAKLQDEVAPVPFETMREVIIEELGEEPEALFAGEMELLASASLGQVYKAKLKEGDTVAIKIQKPAIREKIYADIKIMRQIVSLLRERLQEYGIDDGRKIIDEFEKTIKKELDFTIEALNLKRFAKNFEGNPHIKVPAYYERYSSGRILTMEYVEGIKVADLKRLEAEGIDPVRIAKAGFDLLCEQIFVHRYFHADPHPGNIFALADGRVCFLDFGMMGRIGERDRRAFVDMIYYIVKNEEEKAAYSLLKLAKVKEEEGLDTDAFCKDMGDIISTYFYGSLKEISIHHLLNDIILLMNRYKVYFREDNYLLTKALITIEGVGKKLDPEFNASEEIRPFVIDFYREQRSFSALVGKAQELPKEVSDFVAQFPDDMKFLMEKLKRGTFKIEFEHIGLEPMEHTIETSFNRLSVAIIVAATLIGSALLIYSKTPPTVLGIPLLGIAGFTLSVVMGVWLILSIYRRGKL